MGISPARALGAFGAGLWGARSLTELAEAEQVTPATMSKLVTAMEREGLYAGIPT